MTRAKSKRNEPKSRRHLKSLIEDATMDCYGESEEATGLFTAMEENLSLPFSATVFGIVVNVEKLDIDSRDTILAVCTHQRRRETIRVLDLHLSDPPPEGAEWIEAYRLWYNRG